MELHRSVAAVVASGCFAPPGLGHIAEFPLLVVFVVVASGVAEPGFGSGSVEAVHGPWSSVAVLRAWIAVVAADIDARG